VILKTPQTLTPRSMSSRTAHMTMSTDAAIGVISSS